MRKNEIKTQLKYKIIESNIAYYLMFKKNDLITEFENDWTDAIRQLHVKAYNKQQKYFRSVQKEIRNLIKQL